MRALPLLGLFTATSAGYLVLDPETPRFFPWLALYSVQFAIYLLLWRELHRRGVVPLAGVLAAALLSRVILLPSEPVLESDFYRYLWDGHVWAEGTNPYLYPPDHPGLDHLETDYRFFILWSDVRTIYPPLAQIVFRAAHALAPDSLLALKLVLTLFDVASGLVVLRFFQRLGRHPSWSALYFLNPLVLKEVANSAHVEVVATFFSILAVYGMTFGGKALAAWLLLSLSVSGKLYALVLAPLFVKLDPRFARHAAAAVGLGVVLAVPFLDAGAALLSGTVAFGRYWVFNASLFKLVESLTHLFLAPEAAFTAAKLAVAAAFVTLTGWRTARLSSAAELPAAVLFVLGALLLLSPVVNAWYVLWLLPFAVLTVNFPWLAFTYLVAFSYAWFHDPESAVYFRTLEYGALFALLLWWWRRGVQSTIVGAVEGGI